jgi:hypothetical protein
MLEPRLSSKLELSNESRTWKPIYLHLGEVVRGREAIPCCWKHKKLKYILGDGWLTQLLWDIVEHLYNLFVHIHAGEFQCFFEDSDKTYKLFLQVFLVVPFNNLVYED